MRADEWAAGCGGRHGFTADRTTIVCRDKRCAPTRVRSVRGSGATPTVRNQPNTMTANNDELTLLRWIAARTAALAATSSAARVAACGREVGRYAHVIREGRSRSTRKA